MSNPTDNQAGPSWIAVALGSLACVGVAVALGVSAELSVQDQPETTAPVQAPHPGWTAPVKLTILHTNDIHGQVLPANWIKEPSGLVAVGRAIERERARAAEAGEAVLLLDAGDIFQGTPEGDLTRGEVIVAWMNHMRYDAVTIGNHEFDHGIDLPRQLATMAEFPFLGANVIREDTGEIPPWLGLTTSDSRLPSRLRGGVLLKTITQGDLEIDVAVIGITTSRMKDMTVKGRTDGLRFPEEGEALERVLASLPQGVDMIVLLTHCGLHTDVDLAERFAGRVDVIVGGHSHTRMEADHEQRRVGNVFVAQAASKSTRLGRLRLEVQLPRRQRPGVGRCRVTGEGDLLMPVGDGIQAVLDPYLEQVEQRASAVVGSLDAPLLRVREYESSNLGNLLTDLMRKHTGADLAFQNKTGIRSDIQQGTVSWRDVYKVSPFGNTVVKLLMRGSEVRDLVEGMLASPAKLLELSGASIVCDPARPHGERVRKITVGGQPLDDARLYTVATNNFLSTGGDGHEAFTRNERRVDTQVKLRDLVLEFFETNSPYTPGIVEQRLRLTPQ